MEHNIANLEGKVKELGQICDSVGDTSDSVELLKIIRKPGWTTPAEHALVLAATESLIAQARNIVTQRTALLAGARQVGMGKTATA